MKETFDKQLDEMKKEIREWLHYPIGMFFIFLGAWIFIKFFSNMSFI